MINQKITTLVISEYEQKWVNGLNSGNISVADEVFLPDWANINIVLQQFEL